jgi:hypothetical protein
MAVTSIFRRTRGFGKFDSGSLDPAGAVPRPRGSQAA